MSGEFPAVTPRHGRNRVGGRRSRASGVRGSLRRGSAVRHRRLRRVLRDRTFSVHPKGGVPRSSEEVILRNGAESNTSGDSVIPAAVTREKNFRAWSAGVRVPMAEPRKKKQEKKKKKQQQQHCGAASPAFDFPRRLLIPSDS